MNMSIRRGKRGNSSESKALPKARQVAALCYRKTKTGDKEILLITSRDTGRWILPKGWPMKGKDDPDAARQEAWEEAGVSEGKVKPDPLGSYKYRKRRDGAPDIACKTAVFPLKVIELTEDFPESDERERRWVSPKKAAKMVDEPELKEILRDF